MLLYNLYLISLIITFCVCLYTYKSFENSFKWFLPYFCFVLIYITADYFDWLLIKKTNAWSNNLEGLVDFVFFTFFITSVGKMKAARIYSFVAIIVTFSFIDILFIQGFLERCTIAIVIQGLFILTLICTYYLSLLKEAREDLMLLKHPPFLAATGLFFYYISVTFYYSFFSYMVYKKNYHFYILASVVPGIANIILNSLLMAAFLYCAKKKKLTLE